VLPYLHQLVELHAHGFTHWQQQQPARSAQFSDSLQRLRQLARPGTEIHLITDMLSLTTDAIKLIGSLHQHCNVQLVWIHDPFERQLPSHSALHPLQLIDHDQQRQLVDLHSLSQQRTYQAQATARFEQCITAVERAGARVSQINAGQPLTMQWTELRL